MARGVWYSSVHGRFMKTKAKPASVKAEWTVHSIGALAAVAAILVLGWWLTAPPPRTLTRQVPGMDGRTEADAGRSEDVEIGEHFQAFAGSVDAEDSSPGWPRFRGADYDNISREDVPLASEWPADGPRVVWQTELGEGHAGAAVSDGRVFVLDYDEARRSDTLRCFSLADGSELWRRWYRVRVKRNHGMSRTIPSVAGGVVVTIGPKCHVMCVDAQNGDLKWTHDLVRDFGAEVPMWYTGQCPLIDGSEVVLATGGETLLIGIDRETGGVLWRTENPGDWEMSHSSVMPMTLMGRRMFVYCAVGGIAGVSAEAETRGELLWHTAEWAPPVVAPSPLRLDEERILVAAGYGAGSAVLRLSSDNGTIQADVDQTLRPRDGLATEQHTPVLYDDHLFTVLPKDAGVRRNQFVCYHKKDLGNAVWASGRDLRFGLGPYVRADGKFFVLRDDGLLVMMHAHGGGFDILDRTRVLDGHDAWAPMAVARGRLILRDATRMVCLDLRVSP